MALPFSKGKIKVFVTSIALDKEVKLRQQRVLHCLEAKEITHTVADLADGVRNKRELRMLMMGKAAPPPLIFNGNDFCGNYESFALAVEDEVLEVFLQLEKPKLKIDLKDEKIEDSKKNENIEKKEIKEKNKNTDQKENDEKDGKEESKSDISKKMSKSKINENEQKTLKDIEAEKDVSKVSTVVSKSCEKEFLKANKLEPTKSEQVAVSEKEALTSPLSKDEKDEEKEDDDDTCSRDGKDDDDTCSRDEDDDDTCSSDEKEDNDKPDTCSRDDNDIVGDEDDSSRENTHASEGGSEKEEEDRSSKDEDAIAASTRYNHSKPSEDKALMDQSPLKDSSSPAPPSPSFPPPPPPPPPSLPSFQDASTCPHIPVPIPFNAKDLLKGKSGLKKPSTKISPSKTDLESSQRAAQGQALLPSRPGMAQAGLQVSAAELMRGRTSLKGRYNRQAPKTPNTPNKTKDESVKEQLKGKTMSKSEQDDQAKEEKGLDEIEGSSKVELEVGEGRKKRRNHLEKDPVPLLSLRNSLKSVRR